MNITWKCRGAKNKKGPALDPDTAFVASIRGIIQSERCLDMGSQSHIRLPQYQINRLKRILEPTTRYPLPPGTGLNGGFYFHGCEVLPL